MIKHWDTFLCTALDLYLSHCKLCSMDKLGDLLLEQHANNSECVHKINGLDVVRPLQLKVYSQLDKLGVPIVLGVIFV